MQVLRFHFELCEMWGYFDVSLFVMESKSSSLRLYSIGKLVFLSMWAPTCLREVEQKFFPKVVCEVAVVPELALALVLVQLQLEVVGAQ